jgi:dTDP-4-dehydrorhamnose 3,5-epimerase
MDSATTPIAGLLVLTPRRFADDRGWFSEVWSQPKMAAVGIDLDWVQDNHSLSRAVGTIRGLHYQAPPRAQDKLVRCGAGVIWDVAVDARPGSATYGQHFGIELSAANGVQLFIPKGFLHGFVTRTPDAELLYKCSDVYSGAHDGAVRFDDPDLAIDWGIAPGDAVLSDKDRSAPLWRDWVNPF